MRPSGAAILLIVFGLLWFGALDYRHLVKPDEGRYAEIAREMLVSGDWTTPRLNGIKYFEKPPLQYWATATAFHLFGIDEWTARLWTAVTGFLGIVATYVVATKLFGPTAGRVSALVLASSAYYFALGHISTLDMGVTFFLNATLLAFLLAQASPFKGVAEHLWMALAAVCAALAVLSKGLIGVVIPGAALVLYSLIQRDWSVWRRLHPFMSLAVFLVVAAPWFVLVSLRNPEFAEFFFVHEHLARFASHVHRRDEPIWYFAPILLIGLVPWTVVALEALLPSARAAKGPAREFAPERFLLIWIAFVFIFFSASGSKLPAYLLPLFPAWALLIGKRWSEARRAARILNGACVALLGCAGLVALPFLAGSLAGEDRADLYREYFPWLLATFALLAIAGAVAAGANWRARAGFATWILAAGGILSTLLALMGHETLAKTNSSYYLAQQIKPHLRPDTVLYSVRTYDQTLTFYLERTMILVEYLDEFEFGLRQEPNLGIARLEDFERRWREASPPALALVTPGLQRRLAARGLPMRIVAREWRRVIIATP
jgi:4-amino-4-deoxy-L-arabinose transferase-like glycosyltransferase